MAYYFNGYLFEISNNLVRFRGEIIHIDKFILNVSVGRIWIQNNYHSFGIINNELQIGPIINNYNNIDLYQLPNNENPRINQELKILKTLQQPELKNLAKDRQNVHDSYVLNKFKEIVNKLNKNTIIIKTIDQSINEINKYVDSKFKSKYKSKYSIVNFYYKAFSIDYYKIKKIKESIQYIKQNNGFITVYNMYELQVLQLVWNTICNDVDLKDMLLNALLDMHLSIGGFYCLTGRVTRMIDIFNGVIDDFKFEKHDVRQEMMNKCAKIRNDLESKDIEDKDDVYKIEIKKQLRIDYVDSNILTLEEFNAEINEWIDHI
jgi:hypothetical protein